MAIVLMGEGQNIDWKAEIFDLQLAYDEKAYEIGEMRAAGLTQQDHAGESAVLRDLHAQVVRAEVGQAMAGKVDVCSE